VNQINDLETLESLLDDIKKAMAEEGLIDEQQRRELERLREQCLIRKKELTGDIGPEQE